MSLWRHTVLTIANRPEVERLVRRYGMRLARRFIAGETLEEALAVVHRLEEDGIHAILDVLGEMVTDEAMARAFAEEIKKTVRAFAELPYPRYVSVKLTQLGLDTARELAEELLEEILEVARSGDVFVRIDMEDSPRVDATLAVYRAMREAGFANVGVVLQSYLKRSEKDLEDLLPYRPNVRVVKGAYAEPPEVAYQDLATIRAKFKALVEKNLLAGNPTAVATHDDALIRWAKDWTREREIPRDRYEFQFLFGVRPALQKKTAREGYTTRAYVPFGTAWYPYFSRRIAERPENALFVLRGLLRR